MGLQKKPDAPTMDAFHDELAKLFLLLEYRIIGIL